MDDIEAELNIPAVDSPEDETTHQMLIRKKVKRHKRSQYEGPPRESGFHKSTRQCLKIISDAMLRHNWQEAAEYFTSYIQTLEDTTVGRPVTSLPREVIWRLGTEILHNLPNANNEDFNAVYNQMKNSGVKNYAKICLEHGFHLMLNGQWDEAKRQLSVADGWRYGKQETSQSLDMKLIRAYCGFLDYFIWCDKKSTTSETEDVNSAQEMHSCFRQASVTLQEIIGQPGIWDPFVLSYVAMLEFYNDEEGALKVLQNYAYNKDFPSNPNAHVYLYQFLKRHKAPKSKLIASLRILHSLLPSHQLMLKLCSLLNQTNELKNLQEAFQVCMDLLEFSSWKSDRKAWKCLLEIMQKHKTIHCLYLIRKEWAIRKSLWLAMHFRPYIGKAESERDVKLLQIKAKVLRLTGESNRDYFKSARLSREPKEDNTTNTEDNIDGTDL